LSYLLPSFSGREPCLTPVFVLVCHDVYDAFGRERAQEGF
jgi:hypothetical protein